VQDRLSWLAQFVAVLAAQPEAPAEVALFVADATGQAGLWRLQRQPDPADGADATPGGQAPLQHWQRAAPRPEALQVDLWLPRPDAAAPGALPGGGWPVRLRLTVPRSGDVLDLALAAAP